MGAQEARAYGIVDEVVSVNRKSLKPAEERRDR
jgi:ATP-dependent protease ClpP protease subunit